MRIKLPTRFYFDHMDRELPSGYIVHAERTLVEVDVSPAELDEIESDALYYAGPDGPDWQPAGLKASAIRTVKRIKRFKELKSQE